MKKINLIILSFALLTSCSKSFIQIFETSATNCKSTGKFFIFETDTLRITYSFWANKGIMSFVVYNKLNKPVYIDWKNSSFIYSDNKLNYWIDEASTNSSSYYGGYFYRGPIIKPGFDIYEGINNSSSTTIKPERITFIPPKSNYYKSDFYLFPLTAYNLNLNCQISLIPRLDKPKKMAKLYIQDFSRKTSPLRFRNYLAFSLAENSQQFFFIDNDFFLTSIKEIDLNHYMGKSEKNGDNSYVLTELPYKKYSSFYINIDPGSSVEIRKKR